MHFSIILVNYKTNRDSSLQNSNTANQWNLLFVSVMYCVTDIDYGFLVTIKEWLNINKVKQQKVKVTLNQDGKQPKDTSLGHYNKAW